MRLWDNKIEIHFFEEALKNFASKEQLFYKLKNGYFAYIPKGFDSEGQTLQSRNSLIGQFTEKYVKNLFEPIAREFDLFAINGMVCEELGLSKQTSADLAFCKKDALVQKAENVKLLFEIKMSIVSNYKFENNKIEFVGNYKTHKGVPSLLRSDSMLKAIGKAINIRVSGLASTKIPIVVLGNCPITESYKNKVDFLKTSGVIQGFWSLNPAFVVSSLQKGFQTVTEEKQLAELIRELLEQEQNYFSSMISKEKLGKIIELANQEKTEILKAEKFLELIRR